VFEVLYHQAKFAFHPLSVCLFVCLFVTILNVRDFATDCAMKAFETILMPLGRGRFAVVHSCSPFSDCCQLATTLNAEVQTNAKIGVFSPTEGDTINRSRRNLAGKRTPRSAISHQIWPSSVKGGLHRSHQNVKICPKLWVFGHRKPTQ